METKKGWASDVALGLYKKEGTYDAGTSMTATEACSMKGHETELEWPDEVVNDKDEVTGSEFGTDSEIVEQRVKIAYKEPKAKPNTLAGIAALVMGGVTSTIEGSGLSAYKHRIVPVSVGSALASIQAEVKQGGLQYVYKGIKGNSFKIAGEEGGLVSLEAELLGSGTRASSATAFPASILETWLKISNCKVWMENGSAISISATPVQGAEDISSGTPVDLNARLKSFEFGFDNGLEGQPGFGGGGVLQDLDYSRRKAELKFSLRYNDATEIAHFVNQNPLAIEFDLKGGIIDTAGAMYYGFHLIIPRFKLNVAPLPKGGANDIMTAEFECDVQDDGTNPAAIIEVYNAKAAYLAA